MPSTIKEAALEATILLQAFIAGIQTLQFYWDWAGNHNYHQAGYETRLIALLLSLLLLFIVLTQLKLSSPNRKQTLRLELTKSGLVTVLWVWSLVWSLVRGSSVQRTVETVASLVILGCLQDRILLDFGGGVEDAGWQDLLES
ncbi:hypothetical protein MBM_00563 [Drepanopeziza brunnea f. sp. 'multigermtubi' MB_m1]|uniref:Uncharacterized protein n=1 Tax=Marssonina brunnea f. sp. multigermtubi (strain MB_m1) TaxID=1072389 RepID=K1WUW1_MARBU|nr:uncharacterized protein MBM_00563 [Drepanopeziza brunnea f. sp. 'multigermtubi' MB_m1]EKD21450.1 hypothetical protein MBM_00563 [Drepanopeziza brunnea f. sp. 'multigermtubi' MB_m1]